MTSGNIGQGSTPSTSSYVDSGSSGLIGSSGISGTCFTTKFVSKIKKVTNKILFPKILRKN
jgi:hypothetical protein